MGQEHIGKYREYCDKIKQFYKMFNIKDDLDYQTFLILNGSEQKDFIVAKIMSKRNEKISLLLSL